MALRVGRTRHWLLTYFALLGVWMAIAARHFAFYGDVGGWALSGEWIPYDGTVTLLGVSYDAVRRCTHSLLIRALLHFYAVRLRGRHNLPGIILCLRRV